MRSSRASQRTRGAAISASTINAVDQDRCAYSNGPDFPAPIGELVPGQAAANVLEDRARCDLARPGRGGPDLSGNRLIAQIGVETLRRRRRLVIGATAVLRYARTKAFGGDWVRTLLGRKPARGWSRSYLPTRWTGEMIAARTAASSFADAVCERSHEVLARPINP